MPCILAGTKTFPDFLLPISCCHGSARLYQCVSLSVSDKMGIRGHLSNRKKKNVHRKRHGKTDTAHPAMTSVPKAGQCICMSEEEGKRESEEKAVRMNNSKKLATLEITRN